MYGKVLFSEETETVHELVHTADTKRNMRFTASNESIETLHQKLVRNRINVCPYYQRDVVWDMKRQALLIDSIMERLYVPAVIIREIQHRDFEFECIDGKQRLTSIKKFLANEFPVEFYNEHDEEREPFYFSVAKGGIPALSEELQNRFLSAEITVVKYFDLTDAQTQEIFSRVQNGMSLTRGELYRGWNPDLIRFLSSFDDVTSHIRHLLSNGARDGHNEFYIRCLYIDVAGLRSVDADNIDRFVQEGSNAVTATQRESFKFKLRRFINFIIDVKDQLTAKINKLDFLVGYYIVSETNVSREKLLTYLTNPTRSRSGRLTLSNFISTIDELKQM